MLNQLTITEVGNAVLGNVIVVSGSLLILLTPLKHSAWGSINGILKRREDEIANDLDSTEQPHINSMKMEQGREQRLLASRSGVADVIENAKESGELGCQNTLKDTQEEAARLRSKAQADITVKRNSALSPVKDGVAELSLQIAEKILNKELSPEVRGSLINQYIEDLGSSNETK